MPGPDGLEVIFSTADAVEADPLRIATRLGVPVGVVRTLQDRGILVRFELSDREVRERLWQAHVRWVLDTVTRRSRSVAP